VGRQIRIKAGSVTALAELHYTKTADEIWGMLPLKGEVRTWGEEVYFDIPVNMELQQGRDVVESGDIGYWPPGSAFCIFFGLTPASRGEEIRAASPVDVFGRLIDDPKVLLGVKDGEEIAVERV
jgi:hypothetical protein